MAVLLQPLGRDSLTPAPECVVQPAADQEKAIVSIVHPAAERQSGAVGYLLRSREFFFLRPLFFCPVAATLEGRPAAPSLCQRCCLPQPQIKKPKGAARKSGSAVSLRTYVKNASVHR